MTDTTNDTAGNGDTYTAQLIGGDHSETVELEYVNGLPQKSFVRPTSASDAAAGDDAAGDRDATLEVVWELVPDADGFEYRQAGIPGADYS